jgi:hypothetical protein
VVLTKGSGYVHVNPGGHAAVFSFNGVGMRRRALKWLAALHRQF